MSALDAEHLSTLYLWSPNLKVGLVEGFKTARAVIRPSVAQKNPFLLKMYDNVPILKQRSSNKRIFKCVRVTAHTVEKVDIYAGTGRFIISSHI